MIVLTLEPGEAERLAEGAPNLQRHLRHADRSCAVRADRVVRARVPRGRRRAPARTGSRGAAAAAAAGSRDARRAARRPGADRGRGARRRARPGRARRVVRDATRSRRSCRPTSQPRARRIPPRARSTTSSAARARDRRYTAPSYELTRADGAQAVGARLQPGRGLRDRDREPRARARAAPEAASVEELLAWAGEPLATAEVALIAQLDPRDARAALSRVATPIAAGRRLLLDADVSLPTARRRAGPLGLARRLPGLAPGGRLGARRRLDVRRRRGGEVALIDPIAPPADATEVWERLDASPPTLVVVLKPDHVRDVDLFVAALRRARLRPVALLAQQHPGDGARADRAGQRAARRPRRALRRPRPQRDAAVAARAARARLRRRADRAGRRAARLGDAVARGARAAGAARAARAAVRARDRLARRAGARPRGVRARARAAVVGRLTTTGARLAREQRTRCS